MTCIARTLNNNVVKMKYSKGIKQIFLSFYMITLIKTWIGTTLGTSVYHKKALWFATTKKKGE